MGEAVFEKSYPYLGGIILSAGIWYFGEAGHMPETLKDLFPVVISICAISVGFLATAKSILLALDHRPVIVHLKDQGGYNILVAYLMSAIHWCLLASLVSAVALLLLDFKASWWFRDVIATWAGITAISVLLSYRVLRLFSRILLGPKVKAS